MRAAIGMLLALISASAWAGHEFEDTDILPAATQIDFSKDKVYFKAPVFTDASQDRGHEWYSFDRTTHALTLLETPPDETVKDLVALPDAISIHGAGGDETLDLVTGAGDGYTSTVPYCGEGEEGTGTLERDDDGRRISSFHPHCYGAGAIEAWEGKLLVAHRYSGEGDNGAWDGIEVLDIGQDKKIAVLPYRASVIRADPFASRIWLVWSEGIVVLDEQLKPVEKWYFYRDFDPADHVSKLMLSDMPRKSDPFAAIAWNLHVADSEGWYEAVQALPPGTRHGVTLYGYFMGTVRFTDPKYPGLPTLVPFLIGPMEAHMEEWGYGRVFSGICASADPRVDGLLKRAAASKDIGLSSMSRMCMQKRDARNSVAH